MCDMNGAFLWAGSRARPAPRNRGAGILPAIRLLAWLHYLKHAGRTLTASIKQAERVGGDEMNALPAACGYNLRALLRASLLPGFARLLSLTGGLISKATTNLGREAALSCDVTVE